MLVRHRPKARGRGTASAGNPTKPTKSASKSVSQTKVKNDRLRPPKCTDGVKAKPQSKSQIKEHVVAAPPREGIHHARHAFHPALPIRTSHAPLAEDGNSRAFGYEDGVSGPLAFNGLRWADDILYRRISNQFDDVISSIDGDTFPPDTYVLSVADASHARSRKAKDRVLDSSKIDRAILPYTNHTNYFAKTHLYANSRLPPKLPPLQLYLPSYPLLCLAAQYSLRAYVKPAGKEREAFVNADWRMGTKAMVIKSVPIDDMSCVIFAIRGSQTFTDWAVNLNSAPVPPVDFLDDTGNLCHSGFLSVARKMIKPVAARLRSLLEEDPSRSTCSLLMTGHSAGGAVATLLYAHMLAETARSELNILTGCFKRIHCLTFGTPPISLLPLSRPSTARHSKSLFMSFINEGDPVPRADKAYVRSLLHLYASPAPMTNATLSDAPPSKTCLWAKAKKAANTDGPHQLKPLWHVAQGTLSNAGRLIVLRQQGESEDDIKAEITSDQQLRDVVFGDPVMHMMKIYARRIEVLATRAVTAKVWSQE